MAFDASEEPAIDLGERQAAVVRALFPGESLAWLEQAVAETRGTHQVSDIIDGLVSGKLFLWRSPKAIGIGEFINFPRMRVFNLFLGGGDLADLKQCLPGVEAFARGGGATAMQFSGRITEAVLAKRGAVLTGWMRAFPEYEPRWICLMKELP